MGVPAPLLLREGLYPNSQLMGVSRVKEPLLEATQSFHSGLTHSEMQPEKQCVMEQDCTHAHVYSPLAGGCSGHAEHLSLNSNTWDHAQEAARPLTFAPCPLITWLARANFPCPTPGLVFVATPDFSTHCKSGLHCCHCRTYCSKPLCPGPPNKLISSYVKSLF